MRNRNRTKSASGFKYIFYFLHNFLGLILFFAIVLGFDLLELQTSDLSIILSVQYFKFLLMLFGLYIFIGILSRSFAYTLLYVGYRYSNRGIPTFFELNQGINSFTTIAYYVEAFLNALFFIAGLIFILQQKLTATFENSLIALIISYLLIKGCVALFIKLKFKL